MDRIQTQASELWDILFSEETANTYQEALGLTGKILKESAQLIWLIICSFFVFGAWFADASTKTGKGVRDWVDNKDAIAASPDAALKTISAPKGKSLLDTGRESVAAALAKAREELGLDPNAPLATPREDSPVAKLVTPSETKTSTAADTVSSTATTASASTATPAASAMPSAGAAESRPATSAGQNIGSSYAASTGSGSPSGGFGSRTSGSQSGSPQSAKYDNNQDFDDDVEEEDFGDDAGSSWPPQPEED